MYRSCSRRFDFGRVEGGRAVAPSACACRPRLASRSLNAECAPVVEGRLEADQSVGGDPASAGELLTSRTVGLTAIELGSFRRLEPESGPSGTGRQCSGPASIDSPASCRGRRWERVKGYSGWLLR
jgi:hypothetical protein